MIGIGFEALKMVIAEAIAVNRPELEAELARAETAGEDVSGLVAAGMAGITTAAIAHAIAANNERIEEDLKSMGLTTPTRE